MKKIFLIIFAIELSIDAFALNPPVSNWVNTRNHDYVGCHAGIHFQQPDTVVPVKVRLEETNFNDLMILFIPDTAKQLQDLGAVFQRGYGELMKYAHENQLKTGKFLAWYYSVQPPWIMDIGVETDKLPSELKGRVKSRIEKGGEVLIAHMQGPYTQLGEAYNQIESWLKQNNRMARGNPFEIYLNDPSTVKDPSEIKTDIYQPLQ